MLENSVLSVGWTNMRSGWLHVDNTAHSVDKLKCMVIQQVSDSTNFYPSCCKRCLCNTVILFNFLAAFNYSHRIDALSFGPWAPGHINPLDGDLVTTDKSIWNFLSYSLISRQYCKLIHLLKIRNQQKYELWIQTYSCGFSYFVMLCDKLNACWFGLPMIDTYNGWDQQHY